MKHHEHNAAVITAALQKRGGACEVRSIPVICSDDETLLKALRRMKNITTRPSLPHQVVALKR